MSDAFSIILTAVGASSVLTALLLFLAKEWITHRLRKSIEHEYSIKQAAYEAELKRLEVVQGVGTAILSAAHSAAAARQIKALDSLWQHVVDIREAMPPAVTFFDLVMPSHYSEFRSNETLNAAVSDLSFDKLIKEPYKGLAVEKSRPFIGETLYSLYQTFNGREQLSGGKIAHHQLGATRRPRPTHAEQHAVRDLPRRPRLPDPYPFYGAGPVDSATIAA